MPIVSPRSRADLRAVAARMNIKHPEEIIERVQDAVGTWPQIASEAGIPTDIIYAIGQTHLFV